MSSDDKCGRNRKSSQEHGVESSNAQTKPPDQNSMDLLDMAKQEFYKNRKIVISSMPVMTPEEVRQFLADFEHSNIAVNKKLHQVTVTLKNTEAADQAVAKLDKKMFCGNEVNVRVLPSNKLLCVAQLPFEMEEREFHQLSESCGEIERCFIMRTKTGKSKGYGFVEFACGRPESDIIRSKLDGKPHDGSFLHCDFVKETVVDFDQLNSSCLHVGNLPSDFADDAHLRRLFSIVGEPLFCRVARKDDKPVGFAVVEFSKAEQAEETYYQVQGQLIDDQRMDINYCIPGHLAPEAFNRHLRFLDIKDGVEPVVTKVLPVSALQVICHPPPICSVLVNLLEKYPSVLKDFKQLLLRLQKHINQEQQQMMSDKPGLLGEAPNVNSPLNTPAFQFSILAVMLGHQLQQSLPGAMSNAAILGMLPPGFNMQSMFSGSGIMQASNLIQAMCAEDDEDEEDTTETGPEEKNTEEQVEGGKVEEVKAEEANEVKESEKEKGQSTSETEIPSLMSVTPSVPLLMSSSASLLTDLDALLGFIQTNYKSREKHPFAVIKAPAAAAELSSVEECGTSVAAATEKQESILGEAPAPKPGILGAPPPLLSQPLKFSASGVNPLLGSTIEKLLQRHIFMGPTKQPASAPAISGSQPVVNLMDVPVVQPLMSKTTPSPLKGDGLMGACPTPAPVGLMNLKLGLEKNTGAGILGDGLMGNAPGAGILGSRPWGDGLMGSKPWEMDKKTKPWSNMPNTPNWGGIGSGSGSSGGGGGGFGMSNPSVSNSGGGSGVGGGGFTGGQGIGGSFGSSGSFGGGNLGGFGSGNYGSGSDGTGSMGAGKSGQSYGASGWESHKDKPWDSGKPWGGSNQGNNRGEGRGHGGNTWDRGRAQGMSGGEWDGGMQNNAWDNQQDYHGWDEGNERMTWGEGGNRWNSNNKPSWGSQQGQGQGFSQGEGQQSMMGESQRSFGMQGTNQSYEAYYTENKDSNWNDQNKGYSGNDQMYYGGNWSGMNEVSSSSSVANQGASGSTSTGANKQFGQQAQGYSSSNFDSTTGYGSYGGSSTTATAGEAASNETSYKSEGPGGSGTFSYGNTMSGNSGGSSGTGTGDGSNMGSGWDQNMYSQYMQQYMQQYAAYQNANPGSGETSSGSTAAAGNPSGSAGFGMDQYSSTAPSVSAHQTSAAYTSQGQYGQDQGQYSQGQYSQTQGQYSQGQYGQDMGQYGQGQGHYGQGQGQYGQSQGQYGQGQGQYGQGQGQYGQGQGQYGQEFSSMKRPYPEDAGSFQYSQFYSNSGKRNRPDSTM